MVGRACVRCAIALSHKRIAAMWKNAPAPIKNRVPQLQTLHFTTVFFLLSFNKGLTRSDRFFLPLFSYFHSKTLTGKEFTLKKSDGWSVKTGVHLLSRGVSPRSAKSCTSLRTGLESNQGGETEWDDTSVCTKGEGGGLNNSGFKSDSAEIFSTWKRDVAMFILRSGPCSKTRIGRDLLLA